MTAGVRDTYCSYCGTAFPPPLGYPRTCPACATETWANPAPVSVVLVPVHHGGPGPARTGLLVVRRAIPPRAGLLALAGGFIEADETWAQGGARELYEEAGVIVDPATLVPFWFTSTAPRPDRVLLFSVAPPLDAGALPPFRPGLEASERAVIFGPDGLEEIFAFPLHIEAARRWFRENHIQGGHDHAAL